MLIIAFIVSVLAGNVGWKEIIENIRELKLHEVPTAIVKIVFWLAGIALAMFLVLRLLKVAFWVVLLGFGIAFVKTLFTEEVIKKP